MNDCTILVNSCDVYSDAWYPFFKIFEESWKTCPYPIILNTETKQFKSSSLDIHTINVLPHKNSNIPWGERLIDVLNRIHTEYVIFLLEDYFFDEDIQEDVILQCKEWLDENKDIVTFTFVPSGKYSKKSYVESAGNYPQYEGFGLREKNDLRLCAGPGIWRRKELIRATRPFEDPWVWETYGSMRNARNKGLFYCRKPDAPKVFSYDTKRGGAIHRGLWVGCSVRPLLEKHNITIDLNIRGVDEDWLTHIEPYHFDMKRIIGNRLKMLRSLFF